jgi:hypothetical protein
MVITCLTSPYFLTTSLSLLVCELSAWSLLVPLNTIIHPLEYMSPTLLRPHFWSYLSRKASVSVCFWLGKAWGCAGWRQCCEARAARSQNFWPEPELETVYEVSAPASGQTKVVFKNYNSYWKGSSKWIKSIFFLKNHANLLFNLKAVQTGTYKAEVGAGAGMFESRSRSRNK